MTATVRVANHVLVILASQYFRPPFPDRHRWKEDLQTIREVGLTHIYIWATWSWIEPEPGRFMYDDYDELFELAGANDLKVIVNTIAELQPAWIHREIPNAELVDHTGRTVVSSTLAYSNTGVMPGGCLDHPEVAARTRDFLTGLAARYDGERSLAAWDCWNELRWASQSDGYVCYCDHTLAQFRSWLDAKYGGLGGLNEAWRRRITSWQDVQPARLPGRSYTELVEFQGFLTDRTARLLRERYSSIRSVDHDRPIVAHTAFPATFFTGTGFLPFEQALARGNDWDHAETVDALGCSQFPTWFAMTPADFGARIESGRSAAQAAGKPYWVAELQGGSHRHGIQATPPVTGAVQQRWVWNGYSRGSKAVNFWCWRDEIFGREASGFGITGDDGHASDRLAELSRTAAVVREWSDLLDGYEPEPARIGVVFSAANYHLDWAQSGADCHSAGPSLHGYLRALERAQLPYRVIESHRPGNLDGLRLIILPWALVIEPTLAAALTDWVRDGGRLLVESEAGAYDATGFYCYPDERPFMNGFGVRGTGRRPIETPVLTVRLDDDEYPLRAATWVEAFDPADIQVLSSDPLGPAAVIRRFGSGEVLALGTHAGLAYEQDPYPAFEGFVRGLVRRAGVQPSWFSSISDGDTLQWRFGHSGDVPLLFVTNAGPAATVCMTARAGTLSERRRAFDLESGAEVPRRVTADRGEPTSLTLTLGRDAWQVLRFE